MRPMDVDVFARKALRAVERNKLIIIFPFRWKVLWWLERFSPTFSLWLWEKAYAQFRGELEPYRLPKSH
jgi:short-subunit dehydrogenase